MLLNILKTSNPFVRHCSNIILKEVKEYTVTPTCNLNVVLGFKTVIKPLDPEDNRVIISCDKLLQSNQIGDTINVSSANHKPDKEVTCLIQAPATSSFNVSSEGDINISDIQGEAIRLYSENGDVSIQNSKNEVISARANAGTISTLGSVEAYKVELTTRKSGKILANKIKCLGLKAQTEEGEIVSKSCSSEQSYFITKTGHMILDNIHKQCKIRVEKKGDVSLAGFDGVLEFNLMKGNADLQISDIKDLSYIEIMDEGHLTLRLCDNVLENTEVRINSKGCSVDDAIAHEENEGNDLVSIKPKFNKNCNLLRVRCPKSVVNVKVASLTDVLQQQQGEN